MESLRTTLFSIQGIGAVAILTTAGGMTMAILFTLIKSHRSVKKALIGVILVVLGVGGAYLLDMTVQSLEYRAFPITVWTGALTLFASLCTPWARKLIGE